MDSKPPTNEQQESMGAWAKRMGEAPYPGGTLGYLALSWVAVSSLWTALLSAPLMAWIERRASAKSKEKGLNVS